MIFKEKQKIKGEFEIKLIDKSGKPKKIWQEFRIFHLLRNKFGWNFPRIPLVTGYWTEKVRYPNLITNVGKAAAASRWNGDGGEAAFTYLAVGTGTTSPSASDTALENEVARGAATVSRETTNVTNDTAVATYTFSLSSSYAITEMGLFNASSGGTMAARNTFSAINVDENVDLQVTHKTIFS